MWGFVFEIGDTKIYQVRTYFPDIGYHLLEIHIWLEKSSEWIMYIFRDLEN